jgi:hypothetical protein
MKTPWRVKRDGDIIAVDIDATTNPRWEQWVMFRSDAHEDSLGCDREKVLRHLDDAKARRAMIVDGGDIFDAMQGTHDKRRGQGGTEIAPEYDRADYFDALVAERAVALQPYRHLFVMLARGNHETSVLRHAQTDLMARLVERLRAKGSQVQLGGYRNYLRVTIRRGKTAHQRLIYHHHGSGGGAPVTKGMIQVNRRSTYLRDADIVVTGHDHNTFLTPHVRECVDGSRKSRHTQWHLSIPSYKDDLAKSDMGWAIEREFAPQWTGCVWLRWHFDTNGQLKQDVMYAE